MKTILLKVSSLTSTNHHLAPNPLSKHAHATFFSGEPSPPPPQRIVVGAREQALPSPQPQPDAFVVGHAGLKIHLETFGIIFGKGSVIFF